MVLATIKAKKQLGFAVNVAVAAAVVGQYAANSHPKRLQSRLKLSSQKLKLVNLLVTTATKVVLKCQDDFVGHCCCPSYYLPIVGAAAIASSYCCWKAWCCWGFGDEGQDWRLPMLFMMG